LDSLAILAIASRFRPLPPFLWRGPEQARCWLDGVICVSKVLRSPSRVAPEMQPGATKACHKLKSECRRHGNKLAQREGEEA